MPKNINLLAKCAFVGSDGKRCAAPRCRNSTYCRHHGPADHTKTTKMGYYQVRLQELAKEITADPNRLDLTVEIEIVNALIAMGKECFMGINSYKYIHEVKMSVLMMMDRRRKLVETQQRLETARADGLPGVTEQIRAIVDALKEHLSADELKWFQGDIRASNVSDTMKEMFEKAWTTDATTQK